MAEKLLKETKDTQTKRKKQKKVAEEDDIYKIDLTLESPENEDDFKAKDLESEEKEEKTKAKRGRKSKNVVKVVEDDEEVDENCREEYKCQVHYDAYRDRDGEDADDRNPYLADLESGPLE